MNDTIVCFKLRASIRSQADDVYIKSPRLEKFRKNTKPRNRNRAFAHPLGKKSAVRKLAINNNNNKNKNKCD